MVSKIIILFFIIYLFYFLLFIYYIFYSFFRYFSFQTESKLYLISDFTRLYAAAIFGFTRLYAAAISSPGCRMRWAVLFIIYLII